MKLSTLRNNNINFKMWFIYITSAFFFVNFCSAASIPDIISYTLDEANCFTPSRKHGTCVKLDQCEYLMEVMKQEKLKPEINLEFMLEYHCGFDKMVPKVCCERKEEDEIINSIIPEETLKSNSVENSNPTDEQTHLNMKLINDDTCGSTTINKTNLGIQIDSYFPWMALIVYKNENNQNIEFHCGGSIINKRYILTAAHCVTGLSNNSTLLGVRLGIHNLRVDRNCIKDVNGIDICQRHQDIFIESSHIHPQYSNENLQNDIALLRLEKDIDFNLENVGTICLPVDSAATLQDEKVIISGWGIREFGIQSEELLKNILPLVPHVQCKKSYEGIAEIRDSQICVGGTNEMISCIGDNGGPLQNQANYKNRLRYIQYGVFNFGNPMCLTESYPNVYTRVNYYINWILDTIRE